MTSLPSTREHELAALRRRAYGPDADIHTDPIALDRLRELERKAAPAPEPHEAVAVAPPPSAAAPIAGRGDAVDPSPVRVGSSASDADDATPPARAWWRRPAIWIAIIAIGLVIAGASLWTSAATRPDQSLSMTAPSREIPFPDGYSWLPSALGISRDALHSYRGVGDIIVWAGTSGDGVRCVIVAGTDQPFGFGCAREGTDPTADIVLDSDMASIPPTGLPDRSTLRFVWRGDRVDVWITEPPSA